MDSWAKLFDSYNREARLFPAALTLLPIVIFIFAVYPKTIIGDYPKSVLSMFVIFALAYLAAGFARSAGRAVEERLHDHWGGTPTTAMLRHRDTVIDTVTKARYHRRLAEICDEISWPSSEDEDRDPIEADTKYASATAVLRARRRGDEHLNVLKENAQYGFRRNLYGMRTVAISIAVTGAFLAGALMVGQLLQAKSISAVLAGVVANPRCMILFAANAAIAVAWIALVKESWVRKAANDYARALLNTLDLAPAVS